MKVKLAVIGTMVVGTVALLGQSSPYKVVRGKVIPRNSLEWTVIRDRIEVQASTFHVLVCRTFKEEDIVGNGGRGVRTANTVQRKTYLDSFVLTNYPGSGGFTKGSEIHGPIMAFPVGTISVAGVRDWQFLDYGADYIPPPPKPGTVKAPPSGSSDPKAAENGDSSAKLDATSVATFKFHLQKARAGEVGSQFRVAQLYLEGKGTPRDTNQAIVWFQKAKEQGNDDAAAELKSLGQ